MSGRFNPADYDTVESRLNKFWTDHPDGRIDTELTFRDDRQYIVRAAVFADRDPASVPIATGWAEEMVGSSPVNKTAALENCETSAIGRALANYRYATKARPSQTEMGKQERQQDSNKPHPAVNEARQQLANLAKAKDIPIDRVAQAYQALAKTDIAKETDAARVRKFIEHLNAEQWKSLLEPAGAS